MSEPEGPGEQERVAEQLARDGQARSLWGTTYVDLFFATTDFHASMAQRTQREPFGDRVIPVLSIEDLLVCKVLYDRPKDWVDIEAVARTRRGQLDAGYVRSWAEHFLPHDDPRLARIAEALSGDGPRS